MGDLLGIERKQKLDLLTHLVTNLQCALVLQGDLGAGKSSLLAAAAEKGIYNSDTLLLNAELSLSFESIQYELLQFLNDKYRLDSRSISDVLVAYEKQGKNLVLMIDDAGFLLTGLINALINYAKEYSALKLIFSLTSAEVVTKSQTDGLKDSCHFIDLLSLNYHQSSVLVHQLIAAGNTRYTEPDISAAFLQRLYKESSGNLGAINEFLKKDKKRFFDNTTVLILLTALVAIVSIMFSVFLWRDSGREKKVFDLSVKHKKIVVDEPESLTKEAIKKTKVRSNLEKINAAIQLQPEKLPIEIISVINAPTISNVKIPKVKVPQLDIPNVQMRFVSSEEKNVFHSDELPEKQGIKKSTVSIAVVAKEIKERAAVFPEKKEAKYVRKNSDEVKEIDDRAWLLGQKETAYTMQLIALSSRKSLLQEQRKFKKLGYSTYYLLKTTNKKQVYTLYYGVFESIGDANNKKLELPAAMKNAWLRKILTIKQSLSVE